MHLRKCLYAIVICFVIIGCKSRPDIDSMSEAELLRYARGIHERVITIDTHDDIPDNLATEEFDLGDPESDRQVTLLKMRKGGLDVGFIAVYVGQGERTPEGYKAAYDEAINKFEAIHRMVEDMYPDQIEIAYTPNDVRRIHDSGKLVVVLCLENGYPIGEDISKLKEFYDRGARYITISHAGHNQICDSSTPKGDEPISEHNGLSEFGKEVIAEMNRLGIMVDVSHVSKKSMLDVAVLSKAPIIFSHSGISSINDHPRNADDEMLLALKENGGVIQCTAIRIFVKTFEGTLKYQEDMKALRAEYGITATDVYGIGLEVSRLPGGKGIEFEQREYELSRAHNLPDINASDFVDHIDYAVNLIGIDHVAISSDFDGGGGVAGWDDASETFNVTLELVRRGYNEDEIRKIWGENTLRVWKEVEQVVAKLQQEDAE
jgi:microsomal dipeptidase-like Zn-dependent dipeptidase